MRWLALLLLLTILAPARAGAVYFAGREGWQYQGGLWLNWSSDLGVPPPPAFYPPVSGMVADTTVGSAISTYINGGVVGATLNHHLVPAGPVTLASPFCTYDLHTWSSSPGAYGRFVATLDNGNFYLSPEVMGESLYVLVHWHAVASGPPGSWSWSVQSGDVIADQNSGADGYAWKVLQGPDWRYYVLRLTFNGGGGIPASVVGTEDLVLHLDLYASDVHVAGVDSPRAPAALALSAPAPNPVHDAAAFALDLARRGDVSLEVVDLSGRTVRHVALGALDAGRHSVRWDRRDDRGAKVAPGMYWARVTLAGARAAETVRQRVVVLR